MNEHKAGITDRITHTSVSVNAVHNDQKIGGHFKKCPPIIHTSSSLEPNSLAVFSTALGLSFMRLASNSLSRAEFELWPPCSKAGL